MPALLVVALVVIPLAELVVLIQVGQLVGVPLTILLVVATSLLGAWLLKRESRRAWHDLRAALSSGRWPGDEVTQGGLVVVGGGLLLAPGFLSDIVGLLCLLPGSRGVVSRLVRARVAPGVGGGNGRAGEPPHRGDASGAGRIGSTGEVYDVEVVDVQREPPPD